MQEGANADTVHKGSGINKITGVFIYEAQCPFCPSAQEYSLGFSKVSGNLGKCGKKRETAPSVFEGNHLVVCISQSHRWFRYIELKPLPVRLPRLPFFLHYRVEHSPFSLTLVLRYVYNIHCFSIMHLLF